jgi:hypothetical protein
MQVGRPRPQARPVADRRGDVGGEGGLGLGAARGATPGLAPVLGDEEPHGRDFDELAARDTRCLHRVERGAAGVALHRHVGDDFVRARLRLAG